MQIHAHTCTYMHIYALFPGYMHKCARKYRVAKTHRMPYLYKSFSTKQPCTLWLFCRKRPATSGIPCIFAAV